MSLQTFGWLVLAFPLAGCVLISLTYKLPLGRLHGVIGTLAIALSFAAAIGAFLELSRSARRSARSSPSGGTTRSPAASTRRSRSCSTRSAS